jgi:hypothetical protein
VPGSSLHPDSVVLGGALAGGIATGVMSGVMFAAKRAGLMGEMPPEKMTNRFLDRIGWRSRDTGTQDALASLAHIGFGAAAGSIYSAFQRGLGLPLPPILAGTLFGACVWLVSYQGWAPALGIMPPPRQDRPGRPQAMLLAHLVYGATLGLLVGRTARRRMPPAPA